MDKAKRSLQLGWRTPPENLPWSPEISLKYMDASGIDFAILSLPPSFADKAGPEDRAAARAHNSYAANVCKQHPTRFGFFAGVPFLDDVEGVLAEIRHALDELKADGIALKSSYGEGSRTVYIGDNRYDPIWEELDRRGSVVFLHGAQIVSPTPFPHPFLGIPVTEVPNETFKAAAHLVVTGKKRRYPNVKIILAHLGGVTPFLAARVAALSRYMGCALTRKEILEDFKCFYYDTALSAHDTTLTAMEKFVSLDHILFGTDFPAVSTEMTHWFAKNVEHFYAQNNEKLGDVTYRNALKLFPRLEGQAIGLGSQLDVVRLRFGSRL